MQGFSQKASILGFSPSGTHQAFSGVAFTVSSVLCVLTRRSSEAYYTPWRALNEKPSCLLQPQVLREAHISLICLALELFQLCFMTVLCQLVLVPLRLNIHNLLVETQFWLVTVKQSACHPFYR
jgi:hypothetical protein